MKGFYLERLCSKCGAKVIDESIHDCPLDRPNPPEHEASDPITDEAKDRYEVMLREATAYVASEAELPANSRHWSDRERWSVNQCAPLVARFALNILDLKTQRVEAEHAQLLAETLRLRQALEKIADQGYLSKRSSDADLLERLDENTDIARAALGQEVEA